MSLNRLLPKIVKFSQESNFEKSRKYSAARSVNTSGSVRSVLTQSTAAESNCARIKRKNRFLPPLAPKNKE